MDHSELARELQTGSRSLAASNVFEDSFLGDALVCGNTGENRVQRSNSERRVLWNRDAVRLRLLGLQDDVAANLMDFHIIPAFREVPGQLFSAQITWELHATASTSSRIRRRRIEAGAVESK